MSKLIHYLFISFSLSLTLCVRLIEFISSEFFCSAVSLCVAMVLVCVSFSIWLSPSFVPLKTHQHCFQIEQWPRTSRATDFCIGTFFFPSHQPLYSSSNTLIALSQLPLSIYMIGARFSFITNANANTSPIPYNSLIWSTDFIFIVYDVGVSDCKCIFVSRNKKKKLFRRHWQLRAFIFH